MLKQLKEHVCDLGLYLHNHHSNIHMSITVTIFTSIILDIWLKGKRHIHCYLTCLCSLKREHINIKSIYSKKTLILSKFKLKNNIEIGTAFATFMAMNLSTPVSQIIPDFSSTELNIVAFTDLLLQWKQAGFIHIHWLLFDQHPFIKEKHLPDHIKYCL